MKIDSDKPIPPPSSGQRSPWPWSSLEIGDSFLMENQEITRAGSMAWKAKARTGFKFTCRTEGENVRIWRVE